MKVNANTVLVGSNVVLVPYSKEHVAKYHEWMLNDELRELTASEPLTLDEEYQMQQKWQLDEDKLTFIILARPYPPSAGPTLQAPSSDELRRLPMIGDVNLFLKGTPQDEEFEAEVEIMIAEPAYRRQGHASEALRIFIAYATTASPPNVFEIPLEFRAGSLVEDGSYVSVLPIPRSSLVVRIGQANEPSIGLFRRAGFEIVKTVEVFGEVEMRVVERERESLAE